MSNTVFLLFVILVEFCQLLTFEIKKNRQFVEACSTYNTSAWPCGEIKQCIRYIQPRQGWRDSMETVNIYH